MEEKITSKKSNVVHCVNCGTLIHPKRLSAMAGTKLCIHCASKMPQQKQKVEEPLGTREDYLKDRSSWKKTSS
jgi:RNA polymerase-binding transcription factor DksA